MIGTKTDAKQRTNLARVDSQDRRNKIELVRRMMFEGGVNITSERIETFMRPTSERILGKAIRTWLQFLQDVCTRPPS